MKYKDYYEILGLQRTATQDDIKRAYRKLARRYHPDVSKHTDADARFKELGEAYQALKDPERRAAYDQIGTEWRNGQEFQPPPNWDEGFEFSGASAGGRANAGFSDFFEAMFREAGGGARRQMHTSGQDHHAKVVIDLEDAYRGAQRSILLQAPVLDELGHVTLQSHTVNVSIPKGVCAGQHLRLAGQGGPGLGGQSAGDLYLEIAFRAHPRFHVDGRDVSIELPVAPWEAALGAQVTVPTPDGSVEMKVPPNSSGGRRLRLKGKGIPANPPGDLYVALKIVLPPAASEQEKSLYETMRQAFNFDPRAHFYR